MPTVTPNSANIRRLDYDAETRTLIIAYKGGNTYAYDDVPDDIWTEIERRHAQGESIGQYTYAAIVRKFPTTKVPALTGAPIRLRGRPNEAPQRRVEDDRNAKTETQAMDEVRCERA